MWASTNILPDPRGFKENVRLANILEPNLLQRGILYSFKDKEFRRWKGFFWDGRAKRNSLYLILMPSFTPPLLAAVLAGALALLIFCGNSFTFYLIILWPILALAWWKSKPWIQNILLILVMFESFYVIQCLNNRDYFESVAEAQKYVGSSSEILIPAEFWPYFRRGYTDNLFYVHTRPEVSKTPKQILKEYGIKYYVQRKKFIWFWEEGLNGRRF